MRLLYAVYDYVHSTRAMQLTRGARVCVQLLLVYALALGLNYTRGGRTVCVHIRIRTPHSASCNR